MQGKNHPQRVEFAVVEETDRMILRHLSADGRMSYTDLAKATGLSTSAVHQRVRRLEQRSIITGYHVAIDAESLGLSLTAFIAVTPLNFSAPDDAPTHLATLPEIEACYSVAGTESYLLKVRVAHPRDLEDLLSRIRAVAKVSTRTKVVLSTAFEGRPPPL